MFTLRNSLISTLERSAASDHTAPRAHLLQCWERKKCDFCLTDAQRQLVGAESVVVMFCLLVSCHHTQTMDVLINTKAHRGMFDSSLPGKKRKEIRTAGMQLVSSENAVASQLSWICSACDSGRCGGCLSQHDKSSNAVTYTFHVLVQGGLHLRQCAMLTASLHYPSTHQTSIFYTST